VHGHVPSGHVAPADPFSSITDAVYRIDRRWRFTYVNAPQSGSSAAGPTR